MHARRMTDAELHHAAAELLARYPAPALAQGSVSRLLDDLYARVNALQLDLWAVRDAADAELTGDRHDEAVKAVSGLADALGDASTWLRWIAHRLDLTTAHPDTA